MEIHWPKKLNYTLWKTSDTKMNFMFCSQVFKSVTQARKEPRAYHR